MAEIPKVDVLGAIKPANAGYGEKKLTYKNLAPAVNKYKESTNARERATWKSTVGSLEETATARELASEYLIRTAEKAALAHPDTRDLWADRYTQSTIELYGEPEKAEATRLLSQEYDNLLKLQGDPNISQKHLALLLNTYRPINEASTEQIDTNRLVEQAKQEREAIDRYGHAILKRYKSLFDKFDEHKKDTYTAAELRSLFTQSVSFLAEQDDPDWNAWEVTTTEGTNLRIIASEKQIEIGSRFETVTHEEARGFLTHEVLVHGLRTLNGYKINDYRLATGLPGYEDAEEGLGMLVEEAIVGELPVRAYDRYVDIALALGIVDGKQKTRQELFDISYARHLIREQSHTSMHEEPTGLAEKVWGHIDRIYRGGPGDEEGDRQAIFTKDIAYYVGYKKMAKYITAALESGMSEDALFTYLSSGKFDPTQDEHVEKVRQATKPLA